MYKIIVLFRNPDIVDDIAVKGKSVCLPKSLIKSEMGIKIKLKIKQLKQ